MLKLTIHQYQLNLAESWSRWRLGIRCSIFPKWSTLCFQQHQPWTFCPQDASPRSNIAAGMQWHQILWPDKGNGWKWCFFKRELFQNAWTFCFMMNTAGWFSFPQSVVVRVKHINIVSQDWWSLYIFVLSMNLCTWLYEYWIDSSDLHTNSKHLATSRTVCFEHSLTSYFFVCDLNIETETNHNNSMPTSWYPPPWCLTNWKCRWSKQADMGELQDGMGVVDSYTFRSVGYDNYYHPSMLVLHCGRLIWNLKITCLKRITSSKPAYLGSMLTSGVYSVDLFLAHHHNHIL